MSGEVSRRVSFAFLKKRRSGDDRYPRVSTELFWSPRCPDEVRLTFQTRRSPVVWVVARELLAAGLDGPAGVGDLSLLPDLRDCRRLLLVLDTPNGRAVLRVRRDVLAGFLAELPESPSGSGLADEVEAWLAGVTQ